MLPTRLQRPLRSCSALSKAAARNYATRAKPAANATPYAKLSSTKAAATPSKKAAPKSIPTSVPKPAPKPAATRPSASPKSTTAQPEKAAPITPIAKTAVRDAPATIAPKRAEAPKAAPKVRPPLDPTSKEYKKEYNSLTRRWTAGLIAMPVLLVTSYYLFDRLVLGHEKKVLRPADAPKKSEADAIIKTL
ncbi:hypothetical protein ACHAQA_000584 [Verticillium albo-atrum]